MIFHESPFGDWLGAIVDPPIFVDEFQPWESGDYYRTVNLMHRRRRQEQQRLDRLSNVRRSKRAAELRRRRGRG